MTRRSNVNKAKWDSYTPAEQKLVNTARYKKCKISILQGCDNKFQFIVQNDSMGLASPFIYDGETEVIKAAKDWIKIHITKEKKINPTAKRRRSRK